MKCTLIRQLMSMSRYALFGVLMQCCLCSMLLASKSLDPKKSLEEIFIEVKMKNASLEEVLTSIEQKTEFHFVYNEKVLKKYLGIDIESNSQSLGDILRKISQQTQLAFKRIGDNIHISEKGDGKQAVEEILGSAPPITVSGTVTSQADGAGLPGVNVLVKGTSTGTVTDIDGKYSINVPNEDDILVFSSIGYTTQEVPVNGRAVIDVTMAEDVQSLEEVVVTAFGLKREKKALTNSVQTVETEMLTQARELNVVNSLAGKVAGLTIQASGQGVGGASRVLLRGNRSISGTSQPLYVVDGVPIIGQIENMNPDDIESINVLKGPNAAALYGSRANNGAIVVTTKSGSAAKGFNISLNQTYTFEVPNILIDYQNVYGQGNAGIYNPHIDKSWGPEMDGRMVDHWSNDPNWPEAQYAFLPQPDNIRDFFQTGHNSATGLAINAGRERNQTYFSYTYTDAAGVIPNNELTRHNVNLRLTNKLTDKLTLDSRITYMREKVNNRMTQSVAIGAENPSRHPYRMARNIRTEDAEVFEFFDADGMRRQHYWYPGFVPANPYWVINRTPRVNNEDRVFAFSSLRYSFTDNLSVQVRSALDRVFGESEIKYYAGTSRNVPLNNGYYSVGQSEAYEWNTDFLATYEQDISQDWDFSINLGGNILQQRNNSMSADTGPELTVPELFALSNTQLPNAYHSVGSPKDVYSLYSFGQIGYKNAIFLDITGRNDWSSTLPRDNWSYFYPSVGLGVVISDLINSFPSLFTFAKLRASYAEVGNDTAPFQLQRTASVAAGGLSGFLGISSTLPNENLKPERTSSIEFGADLRFIENRLGIDITYYKSNSINQLFTIALPPGSGASSFFTNGGNIQNQGVELMLSGNPVSVGDFSWDFTINFARNISDVKRIHDERPSVGIGGSQIHTVRVEEGKPWGEMYGRGFLRDDNGSVIVGPDGLPQYTTGQTVQIGNFNPDWTGSIRNSFLYKNFSLNFLIDIRQGGNIVSMTNSMLASDGVTANTLEGRDGSLVFGESFFEHETAVLEDGSPNNIPINVEAFWIGSGGRTSGSIGEIHTTDASNIRLREFGIGYSLPSSTLGIPITISLVGRNVFFISNKAQYLDPDMIVGTGTGTEGYSYFGPPTTRSFGFNVKMDF